MQRINYNYFARVQVGRLHTHICYVLKAEGMDWFVAGLNLSLVGKLWVADYKPLVSLQS